MSDQDMFNQDNNSNPPAGDPGSSSSNPFADQLSAIKNENGEPKYKDVETALSALEASQAHIARIQQEAAERENKLKEMEAKLGEMGSIEDFVKRVSPNTSTTATPTPETPGQSQGISEDKIAELMEQRLTERERKQAQESNLKTVVSKLTEVHGDKAAEVIKQTAAEMNTTPSKLEELARTNPSMALRLLGGGQAVATPATPSQSLSISPTRPTDDNPRPTVEAGKGIARGGRSNKELVELMNQSKAYTNKRLGIEG